MRLLLAIALCAIVAPAVAMPPENADPALAQWFNSLRQPGTGMSCCGIGDGRKVDYRASGDHYEFFDGASWRAIPKEVVIRTNNPTGTGVVFIGPTGQIYCFVPGTET